MASINAVVDLTNEGDLAIITLDSPPVNALSPRLMEGIYHAFVNAIEDPATKALLLICAGRTFIAGADLKSLGSGEPEIDFFELQARIENAGKPVVAAIHGTALGGGLEVALTCNYRVCVPSARLGLPEVNLGLLPGGGGTQRLPRIVGAGPALDLLISGRQVGAREALEFGLIDAIVAEDDLRGEAIAYARGLIAEGRAAKRVRDLNDKITSPAPEIFAAARERAARDRPGEIAPLAIIRCVEAAVEGDFDAGIQVERDEFTPLLEGAQSAALRHAFFAERQVAKISDVPKDVVAADLDRLAIAGDGRRVWTDLTRTCGLNPAIIDADGATTSRFSVVVIAEDGRVPNPNVVTARDTVVIVDAPDIPFASVGGGANRIGMHVTADSRLADIVRDAATSPEAVATALALAKKLGKVGILTSGGGLGIGERLIRAARSAIEGDRLAGVAPAGIAAAAAAFGFRPERLAAIGLPTDGEPREASGLDERLVFTVMAEAATLFEEGVAQRSSDVDMAAMLAIGWPGYTGGPLYHLQALGLEVAAEKMESFGLPAAAVLRAKAATGWSIG